ncbi:hypothetical protein BC332_07098 [Capsicum chinense]|nr:hypothetical protein BC332_07098 [Capsicum chinense]
MKESQLISSEDPIYLVVSKYSAYSTRSRLFVDIRINVELINTLIGRLSFEVDDGNRLFYSFNAFHKESILSGKSYCVCPVINIEGERVEYGYGGVVEGYVVPKNNSFGALEENVGYIFPLGDTSLAKREYIKAYVLEVTTSKQSFREEKPMEGTIESELSIMGVIPDEFVLITGVGRDVGVSDEFVKGTLNKAPNSVVIWDPFILKELNPIAFVRNLSLALKAYIPPFFDTFPAVGDDGGNQTASDERRTPDNERRTANLLERRTTDRQKLNGKSDKLQTRLRYEGGIMALLGMVRCRYPDLLSQVGRGIVNFAKCESRVSTQEVYARDMISRGALWELIHISRDCSRDDIRSLAYQTLLSLTFQVKMRCLRIELELSYWFHSRDGYKKKVGVRVSLKELVYYKFVLQKSSSNLRRLSYSRMSSDLRFYRKWLRGYWGDFWIPSILASILLVFWNMLPKEPLFKWWNLLETEDSIENNVGRIKRGAGYTIKSGISTPHRFHSKRFTMLGKTLIGEVD